MRRKTGYNIINIIVIAITAFIFAFDYQNVSAIFSIKTFCLVAAVLLVHGIKGGRLYLTLYGADISFSDFFKTYCKVTPVSVVLPYKTGEFFRMYCYGKQMDSVLKGIIIILLDRFMDTIALVSVVFLMGIFSDAQVTGFMYLLVGFLAVVFFIYIVFPGIHGFWKKYLLLSRASENRLMVLRILERLNKIYQEIMEMAKGKGIMLYSLSLAAWITEIGSIKVIEKIFGGGEMGETISDYLLATMGGNQSVWLSRFVFISVILLTVAYIFAKTAETHRRKGKRSS